MIYAIVVKQNLIRFFWLFINSLDETCFDLLHTAILKKINNLMPNKMKITVEATTKRYQNKQQAPEKFSFSPKQATSCTK